ncbi:MAG TPA: endonuclease/exonuclease/phosphatase family protein [Burkholderiales bacterium]|nr:endonuclease/exonuclease/phosphatase family protein [Burkholderiales bacterium]
MKLLSWNVQWCRGVDGRVDPARIAREAKRLADPDVLCLQEVAQGFTTLAGSQGEDQVAALAEEFVGYVHAFAWGVDVPDPRARSRRSRFGNLILSRLPIGRVLRHSLPWPADPGAPSMPRVALEVSISAPFGPLRIVTTHLEYYSSAQRADQLERLRALHTEACAHSAMRAPGAYAEGPFAPLPRAAPALVTGDFNFPPEDALHARMQEVFGDATPRLIDAWSALHPRDPHPATIRLHDAEPGETPYCCDFVFVSEDLLPRLAALRIDADTQASDHQPLVVELRS